MIMADVFTVVFLILGFWLALPALGLVIRATTPDLVRRTQVRVATRAGRSFLAGLAVLVPGFFVVAVVGSLPGAAKPLALFLSAGLFIYSFVGVTALATHVGDRLPSPRDAERPWLATIRGGVCLELAATIPVLGWFLIGPAALLVGAGATTMALVGGAAPKEAEEPEIAIHHKVDQDELQPAGSR